MTGYDVLTNRGVTRLCHFTRLQKLCHIIETEQGILATSAITFDTKDVTDANRYDGELNHVCCSIQYPNSWYLKKVKEDDHDTLFKDWVVVFIDPSVLLQKMAKFSPCNAAKNNGAFINSNIDEIESVFASRIPTWSYSRSTLMPSFCPTDGQAEILIEENIPRNMIIGIGVPNEDLAQRVFALLKTTHQEQIHIYISKELFSNEWSNMVRRGHIPDEIEYEI